MSFLSGILNIGKSAVGLLSGNGFASSLAKTALLGYAVNRLSKNAIKDNNSGTDNIDKGVRLQVAPNAESKIPVLYGSAFFGGNISDAAMTNNNKTMWYSLVLAEKTGTVYSTTSASDYTFNNIYWNDQRIIFKSDGVTADYTVDRSGNIDRSLSGLVKVYCYKGGRTAGVVPSGYTGTVPNAETLFPNWASGTHAMTNLIFALVRVDYNRERNITGIGNMLFHVTNTMNLPGDCLYDYLTNATYGAKIASADIITADIASLNTYSAQSVNYDDQGTGAQTLADRYQINGLIDTANPVLENAEAILNAAASWLSYDAHEGKWGIVINKAGTSVASFNDSNILGDISLSGTGLQDLYNAVKVEFPHRNLRDSGDFVNIEIDSAERNGNEQDNTLNITYDIINEPIQAQLLGFIELKQSRVDKIIKFETDFSYYNLKAGDLIDVTNSRFSFSGKLFRIISINEMQDNESALIMEITALEYDSNVYSTADLYRYTRSDVNGIITIGSIGIPGTPAVTKFEVDSRPRVEISTTAPTGVVEGIEFWLTEDDEQADDALRSYTLIGIKKPVGGGVYTSGTTVILEYDQLQATNFYIKTRGFNATAVGGFSDPSGLIEYTPTQTTDAIGPDTSTVGLLTAITLIDLIGKVSDMFPSGEGGKSIYTRVFDLFEEATGVNLPGLFGGSTGSYALASSSPQVTEGQAFIITLTTVNVVNGTTVPYTITGVSSTDIGGASLTGSFVVNNNSASLSINTTIDSANEGSETFVLTLNSPGTSVSVNILDAAVVPTYALSANPSTAIKGQTVTVTLTTANVANGTTVPFTITGVTSADINGGALTGNFTVNSNTATITRTITSTTSATSLTVTLDGKSVSQTINIASTDASSIRVLNFYPPNRATNLDPLSGASSDTAPITGSYFIRYQPATTGLSTFYGELTTGSGNIKLYKSDGTLVETVAASSLVIDKNLIEIPFATRTLGTDYYILMDKGVVQYCTADSPAILDPFTWNFNTAPYATQEYTFTGDNFSTATLTATGDSLGTNVCPNSVLSVSFSHAISAGTGNFYIKNASDDTTASTIAVGSGTIGGNSISFGAVSNYTSLGGSYYITADAGVVASADVDCYHVGTTSTAIAKSNNLTFSVIPNLEVIDWSVSTAPFTDNLQKVNKQTNIVLQFNRAVQFGTGNIVVKANGSTHQTFNVQTSFNANYTSEIIWISGDSLYLNPTTDLPNGATITVEAENGTVVDSCAILWDGTNPVSFKVDPGPTSTNSIPSVEGQYPTAGDLTMAFDRTVTRGTGKIRVFNSSNVQIFELESDDPAISLTNT
jgi:hypothetical protein